MTQKGSKMQVTKNYEKGIVENRRKIDKKLTLVKEKKKGNILS